MLLNVVTITFITYSICNPTNLIHSHLSTDEVVYDISKYNWAWLLEEQ